MTIKHFFYCFFLIGVTAIYAEIDFTKTVSSIQITGNQTITIQQLPLEKFLSKTDQKLTALRVKHDIQLLYLTGYFNSITAQTIPSYNRVILEFKVIENPVIQKIEIQGSTLFPRKKILKRLALKPGKLLNLKTLEEDKETLTQFFHQKGYSLFSIQDVLFENGVLTYTVSEGTIETISFSGLSKIKPFVLARELSSKPGKPFNELALRKDRERLLKLGYFSDISPPQLTETQTGKSVDIHFQVKERKTNRIDIGLEQEEEQFVGFFRGIHNHILQHSDTLSGKVQVGNDNNAFAIKSYAMQYHQPWVLNKIPLSFTVDAWTELNQEIKANQATNQVKDLESTERVGGDLILGIPIIKDTFKFSLKYKNERVSPRKDSTFSSYKLESLTGLLSYKTINNPFNPKKGFYWQAEYEHGDDLGFIKFKGIRFNRSLVRGAAFFSLTQRLTYGFHSSAGLFNPSNQQDSFETESFIIGGSNSIRGYNEGDYPFSGTRKMVINQELRLDIKEYLQGVLFFDAGRTFDQGWPVNPEGFNTGYGAGIRFLTPVGPIRVDIARGKSDIYLHFGIGQLF